MRTQTLVAGIVAASLATAPLVAFKYKIKDLQIRPAAEYASHLDFQNVTIAAWPCHTQERSDEIFDAERMHERGFLPVLVVVENRNDFPISIEETDIFLVDRRGQRYPRVAAFEVMLAVGLKEPPSSYSNATQLVRKIDKNMSLDFEHKAFGEKLIAPHDSDHGVVFFRLPEDGDLSGYSVYFPTVVNFSTSDPLVFFEFELKDTAQ